MQAGLILVKSNKDLSEEAEAKAVSEREARQNQQVETELAAFVRRRWDVMQRHKEPIENRMLQNLRQTSGRYQEDKEREIAEQGLPLIYMELTATKCRAAKSWVRDVLTPAGDRPWQLEPSNRPDLPPQQQQMLAQRVQHDAMQWMQATGEQITPQQLQGKFSEIKNKLEDQIQQMAKTRVSRMADVIEDQLIDGNWDRALNEVISDVVEFPAGIMKGPVIKYKKDITWTPQGPKVTRKPQPMVERVDPFQFYTAPQMEDVQDHDCIEIHEYNLDDIHDLIGLPGYDEQALRAVLEEHRYTGFSHWTRESLRSSQERARGEYSGTEQEEEIIEAMEYWGSVQGRMLLDWGMSEDRVPDKDAMYDVMAVVIGNHVVAVRFNPDPLGRKPYAMASFDPIPGTIWGKGIPDLIKDCQDVCNAAARALVANMGISSGPQVAVNTASTSVGEDIESLFPWKIWQLDFTKTGAASSAPIEFFQPNSMTAELMAVYQEFSKLADEYSGIPSYAYGIGDSVGGAGNTASGLSMLMNASSKAIKNVIKQLDSNIIQPVVDRFFAYNMQWHPDTSIKGDAKVVPKGAMSLVAREQNVMRLQEFLQMTANPIDMQILGPEGRATMLRHAAQGLDVGGDELVPSDEELRRKMAIQQQMQAMQQRQQGAPQPTKSRETTGAGQPRGSSAPPAAPAAGNARRR